MGQAGDPVGGAGIRLLRRDNSVPIIRAPWQVVPARGTFWKKAHQMLQALRSKSAGIVAKILFGLLVLSFAAWGIGDMFRLVGQSDVVAEVGSAEIGARQLNRAFQMEMRRAQALFGGRLDSQQAREMGLLDQALQRLIAETLLDIKANEVGIRISDDLIREVVRDDPSFRNNLGQFDPAIFRSVLANNGLSEEGYIELLRADLQRRQLISGIVTVDRAPDILVERLFGYRNERRVAETLVVRAADQQVPDPGENDQRAFYDQNLDLFMAPEYRAVKAVIVTPARLAAQMKIDEEALRLEYDIRRASFEIPERRILEQMVLPDEPTAEKASELLRGSRDFVSVAQELTKSAPLNLGTVSKAELGLENLGDAAFGIGVNEVTAPVQTPLGWHILRVTGIEPGSVKSFDEVKDILREQLARDRARDEISDFANRLEDELGGGATLEEAARALNLDVLTVGAIDESGKGPDGERVSNIPEGDQFAAVAFESEVGVESFLTEINDGYFILRVDGVTPSAPRPFDEVSDSIAGMIVAERRQQAAEAYADTLLELLDSGRPIAEIAQDQGLTVMTSRPITREDQDQSAGVSIVATGQLFELAVGEAGVAPSQEGFTVFRLKEVRPANAEDQAEAASLSRIRDETLATLKSDLLEQLDKALRASHPVTIDQRAVETQL